jgi:cytochrome b6-f complex iron-sulfur subunit
MDEHDEPKPAPAVAPPAEPATDPPSQTGDRTLWTRRDAITRSGWVMVAGTLGIATVGSVRLLYPRVKFTPPTTLVLGSPEDFAVGEVDTRWKRSHSVIVVRSDQGFYALRSICTHLGCIPSWKPAEHKFKCPCHGSGFHLTGVNFEGPAPRPLERHGISLDPDGQLVVDVAVRLRQEHGDWDRAEAFVAYPAGGPGES